jgi:hypothetical protein
MRSLGIQTRLKAETERGVKLLKSSISKIKLLFPLNLNNLASLAVSLLLSTYGF